MRFENLVTPAHVKAEAQRRIEAKYPLWRQMNVLAEGGSAEMSAWIAGVRAASNRIEAMTPIPPDFQQDHHWQEQA
jgi:hypothetical protein